MLRLKALSRSFHGLGVIPPEQRCRSGSRAT
jgi:hypothetical protein